MTARDPGAAAAARGSRPFVTRVFGLRLFFIPSSRERLGSLLVVAGGALYLVRAIVQLASLKREIDNADFPVFLAAASDLGRGHDPYTSFLAHCPGYEWCYGGYIYPPLLAELLRPLTRLDLVAADAVWTIACHLMLVAAAFVTWRAIRGDLPRGGGRLLLAGSLFFLPLYQNLYAGSVGAPLLLILAISGASYIAARDGLAGAALGLGAVFRVTPAAMGPLLLRTRADLRRPVGALAALATGIGLMGLLAILTPYTVEYVVKVLPRISAGTAFVSNVSLPGVLLRLQVAILGARMPGAALVGTGVALGFIGWTWWRSLGITGRAGRAAAFAAILAVTALVSSVTWNYHLVNELLVLALIAPWLHHGRHATTLALLSYPLLWIYSDGVLAFTHFSLTGPGYLLVTSLNAMGMLLLWLACLDVLAGLRHGEATA